MKNGSYPRSIGREGSEKQVSKSKRARVRERKQASESERAKASKRKAKKAFIKRVTQVTKQVRDGNRETETGLEVRERLTSGEEPQESRRKSVRKAD